MFKMIALFALISTSVSAQYGSVSFPRLDFDMAEKAIKKSLNVNSRATTLGGEIVDVEKMAKGTYLVTLDNSCSFTAVFGKWSKVSVVEGSISCL